MLCSGKSEGQMVPLSSIWGVHPTVFKQHCSRHSKQAWGRACMVPGRKKGWSSFTSSTLTCLCSWHRCPGCLVIHINRGWMVGSHQDLHTKLRMERLCCTRGSSDGLGKASHTSWWSLPWMAQEEHISGERWELNWGKMKLPVTGGGGLFGTKYLWKVTASLSVPLMVIPMYHPPFAKHLFTDHKVHEKTAPQPACDFTLMA